MLRLMIVDDEEMAIRRLKRLLSEIGGIGSIETFLDPQDGYEYAKAHDIDVAFLDISMPDINGMRLSVLLTEMQRNIDIVLVTGSDEYAVKAYAINVLDYIVKPVTSERLAITMEKVQRVRRQDDPIPNLEVQLFGGFKIIGRTTEGKKEAIRLRTPKTEELFAFLACKRTVAREEVTETLWQNLAPDNALKNLNSTLYAIRKAVGYDRSGGGITTTGNEIRLETDDLRCDLYEFERLIKEIRRAPGERAGLLEQAEALYKGPLLKGRSYEWAIEMSRSLEQQYIDLLELTAQHHWTHDRQQQTLHYYGELLKIDAMREDIHYKMMRLYADLGRKNEAMKQYRELEQLLQRELGTSPDLRLEDVIS
ncbi:response regulator [Paenibacillus sp. LMG 31461]|uniref:Response regulator n=1 Tax=Paenibacillus plantarum TaxID=2654975 RepID=A0ABX1XF60_9BACL|nr:BTAD domain-containing putative transcriptional regulator [Paenibacillus plantarum]NOU67083.1 response regulator [Paenibacillus plantarum]